MKVVKTKTYCYVKYILYLYKHNTYYIIKQDRIQSMTEKRNHDRFTWNYQNVRKMSENQY